MLMYFGEAQGRQNVSADAPVHESLAEALDIFRSLDKRRGFLGIILNESFVLQLLEEEQGVRIELLDTTMPEIDSADGADPTIAEQLIAAAANGEDVFKIARQRISKWQNLKMG